MLRRTPSLLVAAVLAVAGCALAGCASGGDDGAKPAPSAANFPVTVGSLTLDRRPEKIVSLSPTATEDLFAVGAGKQVVAADDNSNYPADAPKTKLSSFKPNAEAIATYTPDLVIIDPQATDAAAVINALKVLKIPVYPTPAAKTLDEAYGQIEDLGKLTGHAVAATDLTKRMKADIAKLAGDLPKRSKKLTYYYELDQTLYTATSKTFIGSLFTLAGLSNIADAADTQGGGYPQLTPESLVRANPDMIFLADTKCCQQSAATVTARPGWSSMTAVRTGQIVPLDDDIASRWGPRVVDLIRAIAEAVGKVPA